MIDGPVQLIDCAVLDLSGSGACDYEDVCPSRSPMRAVHKKMIRLLQDISLAELMHTPAATPVTSGK